jgi:proline iminopeptidase
LRSLGQGNTSWKAYTKQASFWKRVAALPMPALAISGSEDNRPTWPVEQIVALMPRGRFTLIDGAQHFLWLTHADELRAQLRTFIEGLHE